MSARGAIFDMDGVLVDSGAHHRAAWRALLDELGERPAHDEPWRLTIGPPGAPAGPAAPAPPATFRGDTPRASPAQRPCPSCWAGAWPKGRRARSRGASART